jgi:hypothetical protein
VSYAADTGLIILKCDNTSTMIKTIHRIEAYGVYIKHVFPPCIIIGDIPEDVNLDISEIKHIYYDSIPISIIQKYPSIPAIGLKIWNSKFIISHKAQPVDDKTFILPFNDCRKVKKKMDSVSKKAPQLKKATPYGSDFYDTSAYMVGKIAVGIILPESIGNIEDWSQDEVDNVIQEISYAMDWWSNIIPCGQISFYYDIHTPFHGEKDVSITAEPIKTSKEKIWINQIMNKLGYINIEPGVVADYFYRVYSYNNDIRDKFDTHWCFTIFVVDSSNDEDGCFPDKRSFAYAYLGGPFMVMTYTNSGYGITNMDMVCAHETGHIFYALDEYSGASSNTEHSGYLNVINANHVSGNNNAPCIMKHLSSAFKNNNVCYYTYGQVGLWDNDQDNIPDVIDIPPEGYLNTYSPDPTSNPTPTYTGKVHVVAVKNNNPQVEEWLRHDITINTISTVEYRINRDTWYPAIPCDGKFDAYEEEFMFTTYVLPNGKYLFEVRAVDTAGNTTLYPYMNDTLTIEVYNHPPSAFSLIFPENDATIGVLKPIFDWEDAKDIDINDTITYTLVYARDINFTDMIEISGLSESRYTLKENLKHSSTYYWKVCAIDLHSNKTWSNQTWRFHTQKITVKVEATSPQILNEIPTTPVVGDIDMDGYPEIVYGGLPPKNTKFTSTHLNILRKYPDNSIEVVWSKNMAGACLGVALADLNNDGHVEIITYNYSNAENKGTVCVMNATGNILWATPIPNGYYHQIYQKEPVVGDINGDGYSDVVVCACDGNLWVLNGATGKELWHKEFYGTYTGFCSKVAVVDLDNDNKPEIIIANTTHLNVYRNTGELWWNDKGCDFAVADLNQDKYPEIVVIGSGGMIQAYQYNGKILWAHRYNVDSTGPAIADLDGDNKPEIAVVVDNDYIYAFNGEDGSLLWKTEALNMQPWRTGDLVITDLNADGLLEVVGMSQRKAIVLVDGKTGEVIINTDVNIEFTSTSPVVADVDNDKHAEILIPSGDADNSDYKGRLIIFGDDTHWHECRKVWNHISYYMTNIDAELLPTTDFTPWLTHNTWRAQLPEFTDSKRGVVIGTVTDADTKQPIADAKIYAVLNGIQQGSAITKPDGTYKIVLLIPGTYTILVNKSGYFQEYNTQVPVILGSITYNINFRLSRMPQEAYRIVVSPDECILPITETQIFTAVVTDINNKFVIDGTPVSWDTTYGIVIPEISYTTNGIATTTYTAPALIGTATLTAIASSTTMPSDTVNITIKVGIPYRLEILPHEISIRAGNTCEFNVQVYDKSWQKIPNMKYTWWLSNNLGSLTSFTGTYNTFTAGTSTGMEIINVTCDNITTTAKIWIIPDELYRITVVPDNAVIGIKEEITLTAYGYDKYGNPVSDIMYHWDIEDNTIRGTLSSYSGTYTIFFAGTMLGITKVIASYDDIIGYAMINITHGMLEYIIIEPEIQQLMVNNSAIFIAEGYDKYHNNIPDLQYEWDIIPEIYGSISSTVDNKVIFTAGTTTGTLTLIAYSNNCYATASINIIPGELHHFGFDYITHQVVAQPFTVTITARDRYNNIVSTFTSHVTLKDTTNSIVPKITDNFIGGKWCGKVSINKVWLGLRIRAEYDNIYGHSNAFSVLIDDDIGTYTVSETFTIHLQPCTTKGKDYYLKLQTDIPYPDSLTINKPWNNILYTWNITLVDGDNIPLSDEFNIPSMITIPYQNEKITNDNINQLSVYKLKNNNIWEYIPVSPQIDPIENKIFFCISTPGTYTLIYTTPQTHMDNVIVYPVPFIANMSTTDKITFKGLPASVTIRIYDIAGDLIKTQHNISTSWEWDTKDEDGRLVAPGVYFYVITDNNTSRDKIGKIVIIR